MPKGPKGHSLPSPSVEPRQDRPARKRLSVREKRELKIAALKLFAKKYERKKRKRGEPNDRHYDRSVERAVRRMNPETLDELLRDEEG